jgi:hypothetical protein
MLSRKFVNALAKFTFGLMLVMVLVLVLTLAGCSSLKSAFQSWKGELFGNEYQVWEYDNFGNKILTLHGDKIALEGEVDEAGVESSYIDITIDGYEWNHVGNTLVFAQKGVDMITDFTIPEEIESDTKSTGLISADRVINNYRNEFGKKSVVVVFSQTGAPICMFQGDDCYKEIPADLPKTTKLYIDGGLVYVHRANVDIFPAKLFDN